MSVWMCGSCGEFVLRPEEHWSMVDPEWRGPVEYLCSECLEQYRQSTPDAFVYFDWSTHTATLLSATGLRVAHLEAHGDRRAA